MAAETFYSALHWAKKAEASAELAAENAQSGGKLLQLGFDGSMEGGQLVFKHAPGGVEAPYQLVDDVEYELDLVYAELSELPSATQMIVKNGDDTLTFVSAEHRSSTEPATVGDMKAVMRYNSDTGYRWLFKAAYKITPAGTKVLLLYPVVASEEAINSKITNCITEIPQDIKLELNNGTLTLKAGSKVYNGNGLLLTKTSDSTSPNANYNGQVMLLMPANGDNVILTAFNGGTVSTLPAIETSYKVYYNTSDGKCYMDAGHWIETSLPIAIGTSTTESWVSIDQVFNGFGYIGSTVFALPGVKGLIPNGRNADGSLRNTEFTYNEVKVATNPYPSVTTYLALYKDRIVGLAGKVYTTYDETANRWIDVVIGKYVDWCTIGTVVVDANAKITSFASIQPFRAAEMDGNNVFTGSNLFVGTNNSFIELKNTTVSLSDTTKTGTSEVRFIDKNNFVQGIVEHQNRGNSVATLIAARDMENTTWATIEIGFDVNGNVFSVAPTPPATSNSPAIATTAWVMKKLVPNYTAGVTIADGASVTMPSDAFVIATFQASNNQTGYVSVNGVTVGHSFVSPGYGVETCSYFYVKKGDVVKYDTAQTPSGGIGCKYFPI